MCFWRNTLLDIHIFLKALSHEYQGRRFSAPDRQKK
jgi:hypothetical protein